MGWKCAPQVIGLVRGEPKPGQKHRANGEKMAKEAGYERATRSATFDRCRSALNRYDGYKSGKELWADIVEEAETYRVKVKGKTKDGKVIVREKGLRKDAVLGFAVIINPPAEACVGWTIEEYENFYAAAEECLEKIEPRIFRLENLRMRAKHYDEGVPPETDLSPEEMLKTISAHEHFLGVCRDQDGRYCGNLIDAKLCDKINREFPRMMRERGWKEMDDLDVTDWEKAKKDKVYRAERNAKRRKSGKNVNTYIAGKLHEKIQEADGAIRSAEGLKEDAEQMYVEAETNQKDAERILADAERTARGKIDEGERKYKQIIKKAETETKEREAKQEENRQAYTEMLLAERNRIHMLSGSAEPLPGGYESIEDLQEAVLDEFRNWEDTQEKLYRLKAEEMDSARKAYADAKSKAEDIITESMAERETERTRMVLGVIDLMTMLQRNRDGSVRDAAELLHDYLSLRKNSVAQAFLKWKKERAESRENRLKNIDSRLRDALEKNEDIEHE